MANTNTQKRPEVNAIFREVTEALTGKEFAFLLNFGGLTVAQLTDLRKQLADKGAKATVIKNSLIAKVATELGWDDLSAILVGPTAVITGSGDVAEIAKTLVDFVKKAEKASIKGGTLEKKLIAEVDVLKLSELISLSAQRARLLGTLQAPASQMARVLQAKIDAVETAEPAEEAPAASPDGTPAA